MAAACNAAQILPQIAETTFEIVRIICCISPLKKKNYLLVFNYTCILQNKIPLNLV